jgi:hypothetical protein
MLYGLMWSSTATQLFYQIYSGKSTSGVKHIVPLLAKGSVTPIIEAHVSLSKQDTHFLHLVIVNNNNK